MSTPNESTAYKLKSSSQKKVTVKDDELGNLEFVIRAMSTYELAENSDVFENLPEKTGQEMSVKERGVFMKNVMFPLLKSILPLCVISPKITLDFNDKDLVDPNANVIHLSHLNINTAGHVFNEILSISGLSKKAEEIKKKLAEQTSPSS